MAQEPKRRGFQSHGIREPLTTRIAGILRAYPDSTQIARELLQNSDDARATVQWYLLDHRHHAKRARSNGDAKLQLFHEDLEEYMGPALLAGSDSVFEEKDFLSLKNLASSEKKGDESKIGQMGIGFNSIYHLTDCPSFISGDQFMVIEPHERIFNGERSKFNEGAVRGSFVEGNQGLQDFPDQLKAFSVLEDIDFSKPYNGTIFRFSLRTPEQAKASSLTKYPRTAQEVLDMLNELKDEALKAILFLKHVQKILIYERKEDQDIPTKLFEIEIINAAEVGAQRSQLIDDFKHHVQSASSLGQDAVLQCSVRPTFRMTHGDGRFTEETWQITTRIGNIDKTRAEMFEDSDGDVNIAEHKLIPWVGIAAPIDPGVKLDVAGLFCFLPVGHIQLPFPVHVNGHFAVEQSRRDIWTNTDKLIKVQSSAGIESLWNEHLFDKQIPEAYALFLENIGIDHGITYDLWPLSCGEGIGRDAVWKDMLSKMLSAILFHDRPVFFCGSKSNGHITIEPYSKVYIAGRDIDAYPLLKKALQAVVNLAENVPDVILAELPSVAESLGLAPRILTSSLLISILHETKNQWSSTADATTRVEMVKYCLQDDKSVILVGLPLLPLAEGSWVEFSRKQARERFRVSLEVFQVLSVSNKGLVDLHVKGYPFDEIESGCRAPTTSSKKSKMYWSTISPSSVADRIKTVFQLEVYQDEATPTERVSRELGQFPSDKWMTDFWNMTHSLPSDRDRKDLLSGLASIHLIPLSRGYLAPLSEKRSVLYLNRGTSKNYYVTQKALEIMDLRLDCQVLREIPLNSMLPLQGYLIDASVGPRVLSVLFSVNPSLYQQFSTEDCHHIQRYLTTYLSPRAALDLQQRQVLRYLPVFETYHDAHLVPLDTSPESKSKIWRVAQGYNHSSQPWVPTSVNLLTEEQSMKHHLRYLIEIPFLNKAEYFYLLVSQLEERLKSEWDPILSELFYGYYELKKKVDFSPLLRNFAFVQVKARCTSEDSVTPARIKPESVVDAGLSLFFMDEEAVFPAEPYAQAAFRGPLEELGMIHEFNPSFVEERMSTLFGQSSHERDASHKKAARAFYDRLNSLFSKEFMGKDILSKMSSLSWLYVDSGELCCPRECRPKEDRCLVGGQMPISDFSPSNELLRERMGWTSAPPLDKVLAHFVSLIDQEPTAKNHPPRLEDHDLVPIYKYLAAKVKSHGSLVAIQKALCDIPWILVSGRMYSVDRVAFQINHNLSPHFVQVPSSSLDNLYRSLGVRNNIQYRDIESTLMTIASNRQDSERLADEDADLVRRLLYALSNDRARSWSPELPVLTKDGFLRRAADVVYDDRSARDAGSGDDLPSYTFLDYGIPKDVAQRLQIVMFSVRTWQESKDTAFEPFFQQENIVDRIKSILNDYDPLSIFNEYLQNASDAGATKFSVILDTRSHDKTKVLSKEMGAWQGPALVLYNDAKFTEAGFSALCKLGVGDKKEDTSKIGRHGLGFNSAYHFTDVPSVVSGNHLVFFDPHMSNLPKSRDAYGNLVAQKGHRYDLRKLSTEALVDQLQPYKGFFGCDMETHFDGTIFRLPLRVKGVHSVGKSSFGVDGRTISQVRDMFTTWIEDAKVGMLFLKNITTIELSNGESPMVSVIKSDHSDTSAMQFMIESIPSASYQVSVVDITSTTTGIGSTSPQKWLVYIEDSLPTDAPQNVLNLVQEQHWSTQSGVAIPLGDGRSSKACRGRLMVHLPTPIVTKLPFHLHGGFALMTNRKTLAGGTDPGNKMAIWNKYLLETCLPQTAIQAYKQLLRWSFRPTAVGGPPAHDLSGALYLYFKRWPIIKPLDNVANFAGFLRVFFQHTYSSQVFPCRGYPSELPISAIAGRDMTLRGHCVTSDVESRVFAWLREGGRSIAETPLELQTCLTQEWSRDASHTYKQIDCNLLRKRLREDPGFIDRQMKSRADKQWILEELLKPIVDGGRVDGSVEGLAVVPLLNGEWKPLLQSPVYYFASPEARELIDGKHLLVDTDLFDTRLLKLIKDSLIKDPFFGIQELPLGLFASVFFSENPAGIAEDRRERLWEYLGKFEDLTPAQELPILKTTSGGVVALARAGEGLDISEKMLQEGPLRITTELFRRLGVVVFDAGNNRSHKHFQNLQVGYTERRVLELIAKHYPMYASSFVISTDEAEFLRNTIRASQSESVLRSLGDLPIWPTYGPQGTRLRPAKNAFYMTDHTNLDYLGYYSDILQEISGMSSFDRLGAIPVQAAKVLREIIMSKFASNELRCTGHTKGAYLSLLHSMMVTASNKSMRGYDVTRQVLTHGPCFLARDGSFRALSHMFLPQQELTEAIFVNEQHRFPNIEVYNILMALRRKLEIRGVTTPGVVEECARFVLEEIADGAANPEQVLSRAKDLVTYIYKAPGNTNWMDPKWMIVPRDLSLAYPYNQHTPALPRYISFAALCYPDDRDLLWTQRGFFPQDLIPPAFFKEKFSDIGKNTWLERCQHLEVLVKHFAPTLTATEHHLSFKAIIFKIYKIFEDRGSEKPTVRDSVRTSLRDVMTVPYILNGDDKDPSKTKSWVWPHDLVFGIDHKIGAHEQAHPSLLKYRSFLVSVGANEMKHVPGQVKLGPRRQTGAMEQRITTYFETQDDVNGFMDVRFVFEGGKSISAHKVVLASMSEEVIRQLTGSWALTARRDPSNPAIDIIQKGDDYSAFWGLLNFLYTDDLIATNGPPTIPQTTRSTVRSTPSVQVQDAEDLLSERVQYLMALQQLADLYRADRLKGLIAQELMLPGKVMYSNVFEIREHAKLNQDENVVKYCNQFIQVKENANLIKKYVEDEIVAAETKLAVLETYLGGEGCEGDKVEAKEDLKEELEDLKDHLEELNKKR
ncbi:hypothetical protein BGX24_002544 [Mortierella sp. AD032]|nr:hypothetical protein BGX24_002544 [Mortierella sp. AD032]